MEIVFRIAKRQISLKSNLITTPFYSFRPRLCKPRNSFHILMTQKFISYGCFACARRERYVSCENLKPGETEQNKGDSFNERAMRKVVAVLQKKKEGKKEMFYRLSEHELRLRIFLLDTIECVGVVTYKNALMFRVICFELKTIGWLCKQYGVPIPISTTRRGNNVSLRNFLSNKLSNSV